MEEPNFVGLFHIHLLMIVFAKPTLCTAWDMPNFTVALPSDTFELAENYLSVVSPASEVCELS
jgi:hypothetical protein